jgi:glutamate-1-semialdehyde 2,1-aminomutase
MNHIAPAGSIYQAGTLSGNPLAMTAGLVTLRRLRDKSVYEQLERAAARLCGGLSRAAVDAGIKTITNRVGSMWTTFFTDQPVVDWSTANRSDRELYGRFFHAMLDEGVYLAPSQFEAAFVSAAHDENIIDRSVAAAGRAFNALKYSIGG